LHGGIGYTWEHELHLYLKRARLNQLLFGDSAWHREILAAAALASA
jgi:3-oxochol-4-en-24-oyl-CoA dehydrogenase